MSKLDLCGYWQMFGHALEERYHRKDQFKDGMTRIKTHYSQLQPGPQQRDLTVDDVLELFSDDLPYSDDWSKPDRDDLKQRMEKERVADLIRRLPRDGYDEKLIGGIRYCFRDLGLAALILPPRPPGPLCYVQSPPGEPAIRFGENGAGVLC